MVFPAVLFLCLSTVVATALTGPIGKTGRLFELLYLVAFGLLAVLIGSLPKEWSPKRTFWFAILLGLAARVVFLFFPAGNDVNRYVWEGHVQTIGVNPYAFSPDDPVFESILTGPIREVWAGINHKDASACYPPGAMLLFRLLAKIEPDPFFFKLVFAAAEFFVLFPLAAILKRLRFPMKRLLWYAGNPLLPVFIAGEGHLDGLMIFFLCLGIALVLKGKDAVGFFCIGLGAMVKYFAWLAVPFLIRKDNWKKSFAAFVPALLAILYLDAGFGIWRSLSVFGLNMHYNDALTTVFRAIGESFAVPAAVCILAIGLCLIFLIVQDRFRSVYFAFGLLLLCLPTLHPWYLSLVAPFAAAYASIHWLVLQASAAFTFSVSAVEYRTGVFQEIHWVKWIEYAPFYVLLILSLFRGGPRPAVRFREVQNISVIVPVLNESGQIRSCIESVLNEPEVSQIIVADGGSTDDTISVAKSLGAKVVSAKKGRGHQIRAGVNSAVGDVTLVLHADCRLREGTARRIVETLNRKPSCAGGSLGMSFDRQGWKMRPIAVSNNLRSKLTGISFGDQGQFFRAEILPLIGGFPDRMLMEDVELALRLKSVGQTAFLQKGVIVSGRLWQRSAYVARIFKVLRLCVLYLVQRRLGLADESGRSFYADYYGESSGDDKP